MTHTRRKSHQQHRRAHRKSRLRNETSKLRRELDDLELELQKVERSILQTQGLSSRERWSIEDTTAAMESDLWRRRILQTQIETFKRAIERSRDLENSIKTFKPEEGKRYFIRTANRRGEFVQEVRVTDVRRTKGGWFFTWVPAPWSPTSPEWGSSAVWEEKYSPWGLVEMVEVPE